MFVQRTASFGTRTGVSPFSTLHKAEIGYCGRLRRCGKPATLSPFIVITTDPSVAEPAASGLYVMRRLSEPLSPDGGRPVRMLRLGCHR